MARPALLALLALLVIGSLVSLALRAGAQVRTSQRISDTEGGFTGILDDEDRFDGSVSSLGDLDGDGTVDAVVGAWNDDDGGLDRGAVWILFLSDDGTVEAHQKISDTQGGFGGTLHDGDRFGVAVAALGDFDGDTVEDLAVGAYFDDDGGTNRGAVWILFLNDDGTVKAHQKISDTQGGFGGTLHDSDSLTRSLRSLGDVDDDGIDDLIAGAWNMDDGGPARGAAWVLAFDPVLPRCASTQRICAAGAVDLGSGAVADVLRVNGSIGDAERRVVLGTSEAISITLDAAPLGPDPGKYVFYAWFTTPQNCVDLRVGAQSLGCTVNPTPLSDGSPKPFRCVRSTGIPALVCEEVQEINGPDRAPWTLDVGQGFQNPVAFALQAILEDDGAANTKNFSVTNAVTLIVEP